MFKVFASAVSLLFVTALACAEVTVLGAYSNRAIADTHAQGYGLQLWQEGNNYFGFFSITTGMSDEVPMGVLEDLRYDPKDHSFLFKTKMTVSQTTVTGETWTPTRDTYRFEGTLTADQISGQLIHTDALQPDTPATGDNITLYRAKEQEAAMPVPASYDQWAQLAGKLLALYGPKW